ncbi:hypothetical protein ACIQUB_08345 [Rhizobium sp. NPDC090275]|uniref:hypothetical protein n=1 Tax=Rhizobium sp. NPDC090275 TaxID=3364498 RepID=UPI00383BA954
MVKKQPPSGEEILAWVKQGLELMRAAGVTMPPELILRSSTAADPRPLTSAQEYVRDQVDHFISTSLEMAPAGAPLQAQKLYEAYRRFADRNHAEPIMQTAFGRALSKRLRKEKLGGRIYYFGVRLQDDPGLPL